jgi:hypothetical protein
MMNLVLELMVVGTEEVVDDCQGYGFKESQKAVANAERRGG